MARIAFENLRLNRGILEVRYPKGYRYWDVCGKCILDMNSRSGGKIDFLELTTEECILSIAEKPNAQASFGFKHLTLSANKLKNIRLFRDVGPLLLDVVRTHLEVEEISRVGFRLFYVLEMESYEKAERFTEGLELCTIDVKRFEDFGDSVSIGQSIVTASDGETKTRISVSAAKRKDDVARSVAIDEYAPEYAILLDIDFYKENIKVEGFDIETFIVGSHKKIKDHVGRLLNK